MRLQGFLRGLDPAGKEHPAIPATDEQVSEILTTLSYSYLEYAPGHRSGGAFEEEEFGPDPY